MKKFRIKVFIKKKTKWIDIDGVNHEGTYKKKIEDGFKKKYYNGKLCNDSFWICGIEIYSSKWECYYFNITHPEDRKNQYNESREYDLLFMINLFLNDIINNNKERGEQNNVINKLDKMRKNNELKIKATFETLNEGVLALSYGKNDLNNIILKVDPENWAKASVVKRWYTLYHELGHDVLDFDHGQGGKMMFNFADYEYDWNKFNEDRNYMFDTFLNNKNAITKIKVSKQKRQ